MQASIHVRMVVYIYMVHNSSIPISWEWWFNIWVHYKDKSFLCFYAIEGEKKNVPIIGAHCDKSVIGMIKMKAFLETACHF